MLLLIIYLWFQLSLESLRLGPPVNNANLHTSPNSHVISVILLELLM